MKNSKIINQTLTLSVSKTMVRNFIVALIVLIPVALFNMWILTTIQAVENQHEIRITNVESTLNARGLIGTKYVERLNNLEGRFNNIEKSIKNIDVNVKILVIAKNKINSKKNIKND